MAPTWPDAAWLRVSATPYACLQRGDCIAYRAGPQLITHRLLDKQTAQGSSFFCAKADRSAVPEPWYPQQDYLGRVEAWATAAEGRVVRLASRSQHWRGWCEWLRAQQHGLRALLLQRCLPAHPWAEQAATLSPPQRRAVWGRNQLNLYCLKESVHHLRAQGIEPVVLKGMALLIQGLAHAEERECADVDLWVEPDQAQQALAALRAQGYQPVGLHPEQQAACWQMSVLRAPNGALLDLHWTLTNNAWRLGGLLPTPAHSVRAHQCPVVYEGEPYTVLDPAAHWLHAALHVLLSGGRGAKWWRELAGLGRRLTHAQWCRVGALAQQWGATVVLWSAADALRRAGSPCLPAELAQCIRPHWAQRQALRLTLAYGLFGRRASRLQCLWLEWLLLPSFKARGYYVKKVLEKCLTR
jgi:hypothetical protein